MAKVNELNLVKIHDARLNSSEKFKSLSVLPREGKGKKRFSRGRGERQLGEGKGRGKEKVWGTFPFPSLVIGLSSRNKHNGIARNTHLEILIDKIRSEIVEMLDLDLSEKHIFGSNTVLIIGYSLIPLYFSNYIGNFS